MTKGPSERTSARRQFLRFSAFGAALASVVVVGCSRSVEGHASAGPEPSPTPASTFNSCAAFTDEQLTAAGLDAARGAEPYSVGTGGSTETGCSWWATGGNTADFTVDVGQASRTVDEYLANPSTTATQTQIAGRRVIDFRSSADQPDCDYAIVAPTGSVVIAVTPVGTQFRHDEACAAASRVLAALAPALP